MYQPSEAGRLPDDHMPILLKAVITLCAAKGLNPQASIRKGDDIFSGIKYAYDSYEAALQPLLQWARKCLSTLSWVKVDGVLTENLKLKGAFLERFSNLNGDQLPLTLSMTDAIESI